LTVDGSTFTSGTANWGGGGAVYGYYYTDVVVQDSTFRSNSSRSGGGGLSAYYYANLSVEDSVFDGNSADQGYGGAINHTCSGRRDDLTVKNTVFNDNRALYSGGGIYLSSVENLEIEDSYFCNNQAGVYYSGGGMYIYYTASTEVETTTFCDNSARYGGGVYSFYCGYYNGEDVWRNNTFQENYAGYYGGGVYSYVDYYREMTNNTFLGNEAGTAGGALYAISSYLDFRNNIVAFTETADAIYGNSTTATNSSFEFNAFWDNDGGDAAGSLTEDHVTGSGNITADPMVTDWSEDGDCSNDDLRLDAGSALVNAGDPQIDDTDGSPSDIGAYGGPYAPDFDGDGDGYGEDEDCDDTNPEVHPGAEEIFYDGLDNDCDADTVDDDQDGDGVPVEDDLDDLDPSVGEPEDETYNPCDPSEDEEEEMEEPPCEEGSETEACREHYPGRGTYKGSGGLSCTTGPSGAAGLGLVLAGLAVLRRRRD